MKLHELVNSCQNQWKGLFGKNEDFRLIIQFEIPSNKKEEQKIVLYANYHENEKYLNDLRNREVRFWELKYKDNLIVEIEGHY